MSACLEAHGFAIIKDALPDDIVAGLRKAVWDGTDPDRTLGPGESRTRHAWIESGPGAWSLLEYEPFMEIHPPPDRHGRADRTPLPPPSFACRGRRR